MNPSRTLKNTFKKANRNWPSLKLWKVSNSNLENVVYAPINPMGIRYRQFAFQSVADICAEPEAGEGPGEAAEAHHPVFIH
jgi:hypothetical protein